MCKVNCEVDGGVSGDKEDNLHEGVVWRDKVGKEIQVTGGEDQSK